MSGSVARLGSSPRSADDRAQVVGEARFLADLVEPGTLRAGFVRSYWSHGLLRGVHTSEAAALPGVIAILTATDLGLADLAVGEGHGSGLSGPDGMARPPLARTRVRFAGEPVAIVVAETEYRLADALAAVTMDVEPLTPVLDVGTAVGGQELLFPDTGTNVVSHQVERLGVPAGRCPVSVTITAENQRLAASPIETLGLLAIPEPDGRITVWCGHQAPHALRAAIAAALELPKDRLRVRVPSVGGAFGLKGIAHPEYVVVVATAIRLGRPVLWLASRSEELAAATHGRAQHGRLTLSGDASGRILRAELEVMSDLGAYPHSGSDLLQSTRLMATGPYDIPDVRLDLTAVVTNRSPIGPYRGAGRPEAAYILERGIDAYARTVGMDPAEVRRRNFIRPEAMPWRTPTGALYDGGRYEEALDLALRLADVATVRREQAARWADGRDPIGLGIGFYVDRSGGDIDSGEFARVEIELDGHAIVRTGSMASGQGHPTIWRQVVGEVLGLPLESIAFVSGDTDAVARGIGTFGSRSTQRGAAAAYRTAGALVDRAREIAANLLEARTGDLELAGGAFRVVGSPSNAVTLAEIATELATRGEVLAAEEDYVPGALTFPYGVFVAIVAIDPGTGTLTVRELVAVNDCGTILNPVLADAQVVGSAVQGLGQAVLEAVVYNEDGQPVTGTLSEYLLPTAQVAPPMTLGWLETPAPSNPLGAKGIGESGCIGVPQAIVNAALDALAPLGVDDLAMPLSASRIWEAIQTAGRRPEGTQEE